MQTTKTTRNMLKKLFGVVAASAFVAMPMASVVAPAEAAPRIMSDNDRNRGRDRDERTLEGVVTVDRAGRNFTLRQNNGSRIEVRTENREPFRLSTGDRVRVRGFFRRNQPNTFYAESVQILNNQNDSQSRTFTGRVTSIVSNEDFDVTIDGKTYNVTTKSRLPRRLNRGDIVRIFGRRSGSNDIKNATVVIIDNNGNNGNNGNFGTFEGFVSDVDSDQRFNIVVNGTTYDVVTTTRLPRGLNRGDRVRVYGRRSGGNDITNASVIILSNNNNGNNGNFGTFEGRVSDVDSDERFNLVVNGVTFDVTTTTRLPRRLNRGDRVRVYGRRSAGNDITNASVTILNNR